MKLSLISYCKKVVGIRGNLFPGYHNLSNSFDDTNVRCEMIILLIMQHSHSLR